MKKPGDRLVTLLMGALVAFAAYHVLRWAVIDASFRGTTREDCHAGGACWVFVKQRLPSFIYGLYPDGERWRVNVVLALLVVCAFLRKLFFVFPFVAFLLLYGGVFGLEIVETPRWGGLLLTLVIAVTGMAAALPLGVLLALARRSQLPIVKWLSIAFIELWRGVPLISVLFMASVMLPLTLPPGVNFDKLLRALIGVTLFEAAYLAEAVRGGLQAVPRGQYEAAEALGLSYWHAHWHVILPQALRKALPGIVNSVISLFKDTSLVLVIGMFDLLGMVQAALTDANWLGFAPEGYVFAGLVYWVFCFSMSRYSQRLEKRL
jgi:general L-amino acid transport system permease protein